MIETRSPTSRLERPGTSVAMSYDGALSARIVVHTDDELDAARSAAALVCDMLRDAQAQGITTVRITLDPSSPMCAEVLGDATDVSDEYYLHLYASRQGVIRLLIRTGLSRWAYPAVYVAGEG